MQTILKFLSGLSEQMGRALRFVTALPSLPAGDHLHDRNYRRIFASVIITHFGAQITMLALPLTAAKFNGPPTDGLSDGGEIVPFDAVVRPRAWLARVAEGCRSTWLA